MKKNLRTASVRGKFIPKATIEKMISNYRDGGIAKQKLRYSHFSLEKVLDLFINNGIIDPEMPLSLQREKITQHGLKLQMGRHDKSTCLEHPEYEGMDAIILLNTATSDHQNSELNNRWDCDDWGLDMGQICPPECGQGGDVCETDTTYVSHNL